MASIYPNTSTEYNIMLQDMSNHMSRSQLLHRLSTHSSSTSGSSRRAPPRITKQNSAGNSPHNVQRRRTTANAARTYPRLSQSSPYETQEQYLRNLYSSQPTMPAERPMSWHPGSDMISTPATQGRTGEPAIGNTIAGFQNLAVSGLPTSSVQQPLENSFAMGYGFPVSTPLTMPDNSPSESEDYGLAPESVYGLGSSYNSEPIYNPYSYNTLQQLQHSYIPQSSAPNPYPIANYQLPHWPEPQPSFGHDFQDLQNSADLCQWPSNVEPKPNVKAATQVSKRANKVLSGIGLYDDKVPDFGSGTSGDPNRNSMGKGLKLEETWHPPKDEDENDDDDDDDDDEEGSCPTDEEEEIEEEPPIIATVPQHAQTEFYQPYGDLSQQSFFFTNDDDPYTGEDAQFSNYLAYGQDQAKPQDAVTSNFLWC